MRYLWYMQVRVDSILGASHDLSILCREILLCVYTCTSHMYKPLASYMHVTCTRAVPHAHACCLPTTVVLKIAYLEYHISGPLESNCLEVGVVYYTN